MLMENPRIMSCEKMKRPLLSRTEKKLSEGEGKEKKERKKKYTKTKGRIPAQKQVRIQERR